MKQLLVLSGKGGTGKTTVAAALIALSHCRAYADCDVDAPNLHIIEAAADEPEKADFFGLEKARIDPARCLRCGLCQRLCRFDAIKDFAVEELACEGCGLCARVCPAQAVTLKAHRSGALLLYRDKERVFSTACLAMGSGASGKLVAAVKKQLIEQAGQQEYAIIDGSPGIGCPVMASISGAQGVLIVAEPTVSGLHDMKRILETARRLGAECGVCINKYDVSLVLCRELKQACTQNRVPVLGEIPYDETVVAALRRGQMIADYPGSPAGKAIRMLWKRLCRSGLLPDTGEKELKSQSENKQ